MRRRSLPFVDESFRGSGGVRVFRLDRERTIAALRQGARALLDDVPESLEVRLFGSLARGDATPRSDADLWILLRSSTQPFVDRGAALSRFFDVAGLGCDVLAYTESEWEELRRAGRRLVSVVDEEGMVLARRAEIAATPPPRAPRA